MERKEYIKPEVIRVDLYCKYHLMQQSGREAITTGDKVTVAYSRESSIWDDEEEEENTGGWFQ